MCDHGSERLKQKSGKVKEVMPNLDGSDRKSKVKWIEDEVSQIVEEALELYFKDTSTAWQFIARAQKVLPPHRQRRILGRNAVGPDIVRRFCELRAHRLELIDTPIVIEKEVLVERSRADLVGSITDMELTELVMARVTPLIQSLLTSRGNHAGTAHNQDIKPPEAPSTRESHHQDTKVVVETPKKPRVLIVGFLPGQQKEIENKSSNFNLDLRFSGKMDKKIASQPSCDYCVMLRKISHAGSNKVKKFYGGDRVIVIDGITGAMSALADINSRANKIA